MSKRTEAVTVAMLFVLCLLLFECRRADEVPPPSVGVLRATNGAQATAPAEPRQLEPLPPPFMASNSWGEATGQHTACPSSLCNTPAARAASGQVQGCAQGTVSALETLPEPAQVAGARRDCSKVIAKSSRRSSRGARRSQPSHKSAPNIYRVSAAGAGDGRLIKQLMGGAAPMPTESSARRSPQAPPPPSPGSPQTTSGTTRSLDAPAYLDGSADRLLVIEASPRASGEASQGTLRAQGPDGQTVGEFPLQHTEVTAEITGYINRTVVEQRYTNPFSEVIEAVYVFPLPGMSAVNDFVMDVHGRRIVGIIRPREEAERIYAEARARGQTASLLTQERPNIFTQSVANIEPGGEVVIRITFFEQLQYESGHYEWNFPMVVGPRYIPGSPQPAEGTSSGGASTAPASAPPGGGGTSPPTDQVADADRITPPVLGPSERSGHDIGLTVTLDAGLPVQDLVAVAHCVEVAEHGAARRVVRLLASDSIPNRDFVLRWSVAGAETQFGVLAHRGDQDGFLTLMMQPPSTPTDDQVMPREITFLLDVSGSMSGIPLGIAKSVILQSMERLRPNDRFNIFFFASGNGQLWPSARRGSRENLAAARRFLDQLCGGGGTEMLAGVRRALHAQHDPQYLQMFVFATDGYIGNEAQILQTIETERGDARFFAFGIGSSINHHLIDGIGQVGGGASHTVLPRDSARAGRAVQRLFNMIDSPVLVDVRIDWNGLPVVDQYPSELPDLFAGQTISTVARFTGPAEGTAFVEARVGRRQLRVPIQVVLPEAEPANAALAPIWARHRIAELSLDMIGTSEPAQQEELRRQITDVALQFRLVSQFTAFVAVDDSRVVGDGTPLRVMQPVEMPDGVSYEGVFGEQPAGETFQIPAWGVVIGVSQSGRIGVVAVAPNGSAAAAGVRPGAVVTRIDNTLVRDLRHLEGLVLQGSSSLRVMLEPGGEVVLPGPAPAPATQ